jgi:hypothetical protein
VTGYLHPEYAASLGFAGAPRALPRSGGWLLEREVPGTAFRDAMGPYPLLCCAEWSALADDLEEAGAGLVSVAAVADPLGPHGGEAGLRPAFPELVRPFKEHFVVDLREPPERSVSAHHRRSARRALAALRVERLGVPADALDEWVALYAALSARHGITGTAAFPREAFRRQLGVPGIAALRAVHEGTTVGMTLWYRQEDRVYYHLGAYSEAGYAHRAAFALFRTALDLFADEGARWLALGAGAGVHGGGEDGLTRFKRGWATGTRTAYLCGRVCDPDRYRALAAPHGAAGGFFPAYRAPAATPAPEEAPA